MNHEPIWQILERWAARPDGWIHEQPEYAPQWGLWRDNIHEDEGGEG